MTDLALAAQALPTALTGPDATSLLFARYVKALAMLCECQPFVDEPDYEAQLEALLHEACAAYGLDMQHAGGRFEIALPGSQGSCPLACTS
jgi:hypothetical protein